MSGTWRLDSFQEEVWILSSFGGGSPPAGSTALSRSGAHLRVASWFRGEESRATLVEIVAHVERHLVLRFSVETSWLVDRVAHALREGRLTAHTLARTFDRGSGGGGQGNDAPPASAPPPPKTEEKTWIAIQLRTKSDDRPVANARYRLKLPDGSTRAGSLDAKGLARVEGIDPGDCDVEFPDYAPKEWGATPVGGGGFDYVIQQGDCLASLAKKFRFADWHTIYDAPENAAFRDLRKNPNIVFPGDSLHIPGKDAEPVTRSTGTQHAFQLTSTETRFRVRILFGVPFTYHLEITGGATYDGTLDDGAVIDVPIDADASGGKLSIWPNSDMDQDPIERNFKLGALDPVDEISGAQARLDNLGFNSGGIDGVLGPITERALRGFQEAFGLDVTGQLDDATRDAIHTHHDVQ